MPATFTQDMGGPAILSTLRAKLAEARDAIGAADDRFPPEYRRRVRNETVASVEALAAEARSAFAAWMKATEADARKRYAEDPVGSSADETRRLRNEMRLNRLIESARSSDTPLTTGTRYAEDAEAAYMDGRYEDAIVLGQASLEVGGNGLAPSRAQAAIKDSQAQIDLANPARAAALKDLAEVQRGAQLFVRDLSQGLVSVLTTAEAAAKSVGDDPWTYRKAAVGPSLAAKSLEAAVAAREGRDYVHPEGALPERPTGESARAKVDLVTNVTSGITRAE